MIGLHRSPKNPVRNAEIHALTDRWPKGVTRLASTSLKEEVSQPISQCIRPTPKQIINTVPITCKIPWIASVCTTGRHASHGGIHDQYACRHEQRKIIIQSAKRIQQICQTSHLNTGNGDVAQRCCQTADSSYVSIIPQRRCAMYCGIVK